MWYYKITVQTIVWVAVCLNPLTNSTGTLLITANGTLRITNQDSTITTGLTDPVAQLLNNGNFVVKQDGESSGYSWQGFDYPTDTLLPGMKLGISLRFSYTLTAWKSNHDPSILFGYGCQWRFTDVLLCWALYTVALWTLSRISIQW